MKFLPTVLILLLMTIMISCNKDDDSGSSGGNSKTVKYELSGTYSGTLTIVYINGDGVNQVVDNVSLPWSKEVVITAADPVALVLQAGSTVGGFGQANESMTGTIKVGGVVKKNGSVNSTSIGFIDLGISTLL
ncbi:hypothetical protein AEQU3_02999 [Aequorivita antarctica]|nr:hypothetical protein AEQU3_02999 [Aequorivita antarctica]